MRTTSLMIIIAGVAAGIAALRYASDAWAAAVFTSTLLLLATAALVATGRSPADLRWWGVAIFGLLYLFPGIVPQGREQLAPSLPFERLYFGLNVYSQPTMAVYPSPVKADMVIDTQHFALNPVFPGQAPMLFSWPDRSRLEPFHRVGHSLCALLSASLGAAIGLFMTRRRRTVAT